MNKNKIKKINIVYSDKNSRGELFKKTLSDLKEFEVTSGAVNLEADVNIFINFSGFESDKSQILSNIMDLNDRGSTSIFDISNEDFENISEVDYYILLAAASNFVTCSNEFIQESIYSYTGRLACLVPSSLTEEDFLKPDLNNSKSPRVLWYGLTRDIMSVRPDLTDNKYNIKVATTGTISHTKDRAETSLIVSHKKKQQILQDSEIVYLPPTYNPEGEVCRYKKVEESLKAGKFVIAPALEYDWDALAKDCTLSEGIKFFKNLEDPNTYITRKQKFLLKKYSKEMVEGAIKTALELSQDSEENEINFYGPNEEFYFL